MVVLLTIEVQTYIYKKVHNNFNLHLPKLETTLMFINRRKDKL